MDFLSFLPNLQIISLETNFYCCLLVSNSSETLHLRLPLFYCYLVSRRCPKSVTFIWAIQQKYIFMPRCKLPFSATILSPNILKCSWTLMLHLSSWPNYFLTDVVHIPISDGSHHSNIICLLHNSFS